MKICRKNGEILGKNWTPLEKVEILRKVRLFLEKIEKNKRIYGGIGRIWKKIGKVWKNAFLSFRILTSPRFLHLRGQLVVSYKMGLGVFNN